MRSGIVLTIAILGTAVVACEPGAPQPPTPSTAGPTADARAHPPGPEGDPSEPGAASSDGSDGPSEGPAVPAASESGAPSTELLDDEPAASESGALSTELFDDEPPAVESAVAEPAAAPPVDPLLGTWLGEIDFTLGQWVPLALDVEPADDGLAVTVRSARPGMPYLEATAVEQEQRHLRFVLDIRDVPYAFEAKVAPDGARLNGQWRRGEGADRVENAFALDRGPSFLDAGRVLRYEGTIDLPNRGVQTFVVELGELPDGGLVGSVDLPVLGFTRSPLVDVSREGDALSARWLGPEEIAIALVFSDDDAQLAGTSRGPRTESAITLGLLD